MSFLISLVLSADFATGQARATTGDFAGLVYDSTRAVLAGARVVVVNVDTQLTRTGETGDDGRFLIPALPPGTYHALLSAPGFADAMLENITITVGALVEINVTLSLAGLAIQVNVEAARPLSDLRRTAIATLIDQLEIDSLPTNGRDFLAFSLLAPGSTRDRTPNQGAAATSGLTFAGQSARSNNITVDGVDNNDSASGGVRATLSQEAVREFQVLTNSFSAEFGKSTGGVVNIVTRSGGNRTSGNLFVFFRDDALNAKEYFEKFTPDGLSIGRPKAPYEHRQYGGTLGGAIRRDRSFFFLSFERLDVVANNFVTIDDEQRVSALGRSFGTASDILRAAGFPIETGNVPYAVKSNYFLGKVDHALGSGQLTSVRIGASTSLDENIEPWGGLVARSRGAFLETTDVAVSASHTSMISAATLNELRAQVSYRDQNVLSLDPTCSGVCDRIDEGGPTVEVLGVAEVGRQRLTPQPREAMRYQVLNTLSQTRGTHHVKLGVDYNVVNTISASLPLQFGGRYIFTALPAVPGLLPSPISSIQAVALGLPAAYVQGYGNPIAEPTYHDVALFAQDDWRVTPRLTIKPGVRYQRQFWPNRTFASPGYGEYQFPGDGNIAPRLAVAWNPNEAQRASIHVAYGLFFGHLLTSVYSVPDIVTGDFDGVRTYLLRFPDSVSAWMAPGRRLPEPGAGTFPSVRFFPDPSLQTPFTHQAAAGVNLEVKPRIFLSADVVYVRGFDQLGTLDYNPTVPALGPGRRPLDVIDPVSGRPIPGSSASVLQYSSFGETWYRGLMISLARPFGAGLGFQVSYTLSKAEDTAADFTSTAIPESTGTGRNPLDPAGRPVAFDPRRDKGRSLQDQRHRFVFSGTWSLPAALTVSGVITLASGRPYNILAGADLNGDGNGGSSPPDRPRRTPYDPGTGISRNAGTLPVQATVDVRLSRRFPLSERTMLDAFVDVFNLFNRTNFTDVNNVFGINAFPGEPAAGFGQFQRAAPPRQVQLALKLGF